MLEAAVADGHVNITQMVKRMGISRGTYYNHINDPTLSYEQLDKYGKVIGRDFTEALPEMKRFLLEEPEGVYKKPKTFEEAVEQAELWRDK